MRVPGRRVHESETWLLKGTETMKGLWCQGHRTKESEKLPGEQGAKETRQLGTQGLW